MLSRRRIVAIAVAAALMVAALVGVASAQTGDTLPAETGKAFVEMADNAKAVALFDEGDFDDGFFGEDWVPSAEEIAEINAETDALVEYLRDLGFEVTIATDELGFTYVDFEKYDEADEALFAAMDDFYRQQFADELVGWSDEEKAEWNAAIDAFVAELAAEGITVETEEIAPGVYDIVWTEDIEKALWELEDGIFFGGEYEDWVPSVEEIAEINAETDALVEYLRDLGFEVTVATDELGFSFIDFDEADEALLEAMDDFFRQQFADELVGWSDEEKAEWNAEIDAFVAELAAEGIVVETEEIAPGVYDIVWTEDIDEALWELECDKDWDDEELEEE
ncbi:MAG: hypothetical protein QNJ81_01025 [Acidimicrobiia bacterium]|nr:hypothetical protein [Acidimicrobiia bacterium]